MKRPSLLNRTRSVDSSGEDPKFDFSSLIDVSFLLLIYFLATSTLQPREADLGLKLSGLPEQPGDYVPDVLTVGINQEGDVLVGSTATDSASAGRHLPGLRDRLRTYVTTQKMFNQEPVVRIDADDSARNQRFVDVLNCVAGENISQVTLGASFREY